MNNLQTKALETARNVLINNLGYQEKAVNIDEMFIVWFCKTLQNWKALVSGVNIEEYIEVTYNGDKRECYVDVYNKTKNVLVRDIP